MAELTSAFPTAAAPIGGGEAGGAGWSWMTGWFNIIGLVGIVASVGYGAATFLNITLGVYGADIFGINFADTEHFLAEQFGLFVLILVLYTLVNVFGDRLLALFNNISVGWHVLGVAVIIGLLVFVPTITRSADFVFTRSSTTSASAGSTTASRSGSWSADRVPPDDVHADRLRRLRAHRRGDRGAAMPRRRASGGRSSGPR
jgi:amino acid transporter